MMAVARAALQRERRADDLSSGLSEKVCRGFGMVLLKSFTALCVTLEEKAPPEGRPIEDLCSVSYPLTTTRPALVPVVLKDAVLVVPVLDAVADHVLPAGVPPEEGTTVTPSLELNP